MPVPARKKSNASGRRRRSHDALKQATLSVCSKCASPVQPHHACATCGFYRGREAVSTNKNVEKLIKKAKTKTSKSSKLSKDA
ncbi:MAG: 50S ribosomal protein L32 [Patescibacteria group bacterium]